MNWNKILPWVLTIISILGVILNAYKNIWCWPIWTLGNIGWCYISIKRNDYPQIIIWIVFTFFNILGWYQWAHS